MQTSLKPLSSLRLLSALLWILGLGATFGGAVLALDPSGGILGMPLSILRYSLFGDFLIPGLILLAVFGVGSYATLWAVWQRPAWPFGSALTHFTGEHWSWSAVLALGVGQLVWIVTEVLMLRGVSWLHFLFGGIRNRYRVGRARAAFQSVSGPENPSGLERAGMNSNSTDERTTQGAQVHPSASSPSPEKAPQKGTLTHTLKTLTLENPVLLLALMGLIAGAVLRFWAGLPGPGNLVWLATLIVGGAPVVYRTVRGMLRGNFASDVVAMLAIVVAVVMGQSFAGLVIVIMQSGGEALEKYSLRRASSSLEGLLARAPHLAQRRAASGLESVSVEEIRVGDTLLVRPGDLIPVDGELLSAQAEIDEAALTGEALSAPKLRGAALLSGSVNVGDAFELRATHLSRDSKYSQIVALVQKAQGEKPPLQRLADRYAVWFTPVTLLTAGLGWLITGQAETVLAVLVVATPCPLILAVPVAVISGINRAASFGIIVKGGTAIEQIGRAQAMVFDKTGTLTYGSPTVERVLSSGQMEGDELLRLAGSAEQLSSHPLAQALTQAALLAQVDQTLPLPLDVLERVGGGVQAQVEGRAVAVGSPAFLEGVTGRPVPEGSLQHSDLASYVAVDGSYAGVITFFDKLRPGVPELMTRLKRLGVKRTVMLTGDRFEHAREISRQAGLDAFEAGLLPEGKVEAIRKLEAQYTSVVMVGDGINDAPALATATVGVAMGAHGTGISAEAADIVLLVDDVSKVADAVEVGQRMLRIARQSIFVGLGLSFALMAFAAFGLIPPVVGALAQEGIDVLVILNALRARAR